MYSRLLLLIVALALTEGCSPRSTRVDPGKVSGTVTLNGEPLTKGQVNFYSAETGAGGIGVLDENGRYELKNLAAPTNYVVTVTGEEAVPGSPPPPPSGIPEKYQSSSTSNLSIQLTPGENQFDIEMKSK